MKFPNEVKRQEYDYRTVVLSSDKSVQSESPNVVTVTLDATKLTSGYCGATGRLRRLHGSSRRSQLGIC